MPVLASLGIITFAFLGLSYNRGIDGIYQSYYYFIVYFHIGFGGFFFIYIIANFLDPLIKGLEVYKIAYRERNFPYVTARLAGLVTIAAFYFLSGQKPYNLLRSGYYSYLSEKEDLHGNSLLSEEYLSYAEFLGFNTHYPNYKLAWKEWFKGKEFSTKSHFFNAAQRHPSPYALVNFGNIEANNNPNKVQATYEESLRRSNSPEIENNLGILHLQKNELETAINYFNDVESSNSWNDAPLINKWNVLKKTEAYDSVSVTDDFENGSYGAKANILTSLDRTNQMEFFYNGLETAGSVHRQAYLLNSSFLFDHDSIKTLIQRELEVSTNAATNRRLAKALALHLYHKGEINDAFIVLDELQANASQYHKGEYFDALGKFALDQKAYQLADDYFLEAIKYGFEPSRLSRLEVFAALGEEESLTEGLLQILKQNPGLTTLANDLLEKYPSYQIQSDESNPIELNKLNTAELISEGGKNAFDEELIISVVEELNARDTLSGYHILVEAVEINPYSVPLLKSYILTALEWNLNAYADQSLEKLSELTDAQDFDLFLAAYNKRKEELSLEEW